MANGHENLIPQSERTKDEQRKIASMGGKASGIARKKRMALRELTSILLTEEVPLTPEQAEPYIALGLDVDDVTVQLQMVKAQIAKALDGDTKAFEVIRDTVGEKPKDSMALSHEMTGKTEIRLWFNDDSD